MKRLLVTLSALFVVVSAVAQNSPTTGPSGSIRSGTTDPSTCRPRALNVFLNRSVVPSVLKVCTDSNTWTAVTLGGITQAAADLRYLKLAADNDPLTGGLRTINGTAATPAIDSAAGAGVHFTSTAFGIDAAGVTTTICGVGCAAGSSGTYAWTGTADATATADLKLARGGAKLLDILGSSAGGLRIDVTNFTATRAWGFNLDAADTFVGLVGVQTLTNKTLTSPVLTTPSLGVATATTINKVTITPVATSSTLSIADGFALVVPGNATISGTNTGDQLSISGNAGTATALQNARTINGDSFDGTANIQNTLASADFANQGTTTTVYHGAAAGNPSFGAVVSADMNITTTSCSSQVVTAISAGGVGTCSGITGSWVSAGTIATARGGTNIDTSGSTGVPKIVAGTWSVTEDCYGSLNANFTSSSATPSSTNLTCNVTSGRTYAFRTILFVSESVAAEGIKINFNSGPITATDFRAHCTLFDTALLLSAQISSIGSSVAQATMTGSSMVECYGSLVPSSTGAFGIQAGQNTHATGTLTVFRGSHFQVKESSAL